MRSAILSTLGGLSILAVAAPAAADCPANQLYNYDFNSAPTGSLSYANSYTYTAANPSGATQPISVTFTANGLSSSQAGGQQMPRIDNAIISSETGTKVLTIGGTFSSRTATINSTTRTITTTITFPTPVRDVAIKVHDIDFSLNQYRDWFYASGTGAGVTYIPAMTTPYGNNNSGTSTAVGSTVTMGPSTAVTPNLAASDALGNATAANTNTAAGNINLTFPQPVTSVTIRYGNFPLQAGEATTGQQGIGISRISFCPMPAIAVSKTSAPFTVGGFNVPDSDVAYTITVTNNGGSPVDLASLNIVDTLPSGVTFFNGNYDGTTTGPVQITAGASGLALPVGSVTYSQNGTAYTYTPASGYDPQVRYIRIVPSGSLAANSSAVLRFRARIN